MMLRPNSDKPLMTTQGTRTSHETFEKIRLYTH